MNNILDLTLCQKCSKNPAVYGDALTWSRCSKCQLEDQKEKEPQQMDQPEEEGFKHEIKPDLVSIVIPVYMVNYTLFHYTGNCIGSVREHTPKEKYELIIVDNGSPIQPPSLNSYYADRVIKNEQNLGVTKAWNQGIRISTGGHIVLLNNDVQVFDGWLEDMKSQLESCDLVMAHPMYSLTEPFARAVEAGKAREGLKKFDPIDKDFSCVMFKRSLIDELGSFDEDFFNYCGDSDFFRRMDQKDKMYKVLDNVLTSHISDATGFAIPETPDIMNKDKAFFEEKWRNVPIASSSPKIKSGDLIRTKETGDAIYYRAEGKYHHIKDPDTLHVLGFEFGDEDLLDKFPPDATTGEEISMENYEKYKS